jgi:hypothetical protein
MSFVQQGDVLIKGINEMPKGLKKEERKQRGYVLAEGEVTGHYHAIADEIDLFSNEDGTLFMKNEKEVVVTHDEHKPVKIPAGIWEIGIVQEYDHFAEEARNVAD